MCLLIACPTGVEISRPTLLSGFISNHSSKYGSGFAYSDGGKLFVKKGFFDFISFYEEYRQNCINKPNIIHFRMGSSGRTNKENCHPFSISSRLCYAHNGIMPFNVPHDSKLSDTGIFCETFLKPLLTSNYKLIRCYPMKALIAKFVNGWNKLAFLDKDGIVTIVDERGGHWKDSNWYSNYGYDFVAVGEEDINEVPDETSIEDRGVSGLSDDGMDEWELNYRRRSGGLSSGPSLLITEGNHEAENSTTNKEKEYTVSYGPASSSEILGPFHGTPEAKQNAVLKLQDKGPDKAKEDERNILCGSPDNTNPMTPDEIKNHDQKVIDELHQQGLHDVGV